MSKSSVSIGGSVSQSAVVAGDRNEVRLTREVTSVALRVIDAERLTQTLREIRALLERLDTENRGKILRALADVEEEAKKPKPDNEEVARALERVVKYAKTAHDIGEVVVELKQPLSIMADWVGKTAPVAGRLFGLLP
jgi:succinate dehydrogenase/fumarate reductase flavoprotein subunit